MKFMLSLFFVLLVSSRIFGGMIEEFESISYDEASQITLSTDPILSSDLPINQLRIGTILIFRTDFGTLGKMQLHYQGSELLVKWKHFHQTTISEDPGHLMQIHPNSLLDFDHGETTPLLSQGATEKDFKWLEINSTTRQLIPINGAKVAIYDPAFNAVSKSDIERVSLSTDQINASNNTTNAIPDGTIVLYKTNSGRFGKLKIVRYASCLELKWKTYNSDGSTYCEGGDLIVEPTCTCDLDAGRIRQTTSADFHWQHVNSTTRYLTPMNGAQFAILQLPNVTYQRGTEYNHFFPTSGVPGREFTLNFRVKNTGNIDWNSTTLRIYFSSDREISLDDKLSNVILVYSIPGGGYQDVTMTGYVPLGIPPGDYYVGVILDGLNFFNELNEKDNIWCSDYQFEINQPGYSRKYFWLEDFENPNIYDRWYSFDLDSYNGSDTWFPIAGRRVHRGIFSIFCAGLGDAVPGGHYDNFMESYLYYRYSIPISGYAAYYRDLELSFWMWFDTQYDADFMSLELSNDGGSTWVTQSNSAGGGWHWDGFSNGWKKCTIGIYSGWSSLCLRFAFKSDYAVVDEGFYLDDITISGIPRYPMGAASAPGDLAELENIKFDPAKEPDALSKSTMEEPEPENKLPKRFSLEQNYPNPFNPDTNIRFETPESKFVELSVFNLKGQIVKSLVNNEVSAGLHTVKWDGTNDAGQKVGAGVYIYKLRAGRYQAQRKMIFLQ